MFHILHSPIVSDKFYWNNFHASASIFYVDCFCKFFTFHVAVILCVKRNLLFYFTRIYISFEAFYINYLIRNKDHYGASPFNPSFKTCPFSVKIVYIFKTRKNIINIPAWILFGWESIFFWSDLVFLLSFFVTY